MSITPNMKTKDLLIEACPTCHAMHTYNIVNGMIMIDGQPKEMVLCPTVIGHDPLSADASKEEIAKPILCGYEVKPKPENSFTIRVWTFRERQKFYDIMGVYSPQNVTPGNTQAMKLNINASVMDFVINSGTVKSPQPLKTKDDLDKCTLEGSVLEALYGEITDYNSPPLAPSSTSQQRFTRQMRTSARATP